MSQHKANTERTIRFASQANYLGNIGSGSIMPYWTVWQQKVRWIESKYESGHWEPLYYPKPVKRNQTIDEMKDSRTKFYDLIDLYRNGKLTRIEPGTDIWS